MEEGWSGTLLLLLGGGTLLYWALYLAWSSLNLFRCYVWARVVKGESWTKRFGQWAVVTGASDGIGKEYVCKLAERGMNVVLIARNKDKLDTVAQNVRSKYGIETSVVIADFGDGRPIYANIAKELEGKDIGVLVNNVGVAGKHITFFNEWDEKTIWDMVNINVGNIPSVTKIVLPGMLERHRGVIINIGSAVSVFPSPATAMYCASKAFVDFFSQALSVECEGTGVLVQGVHPGLVHSNMTKPFTNLTDFQKLPGFFFPTADVYVESALATVGYTDYTYGFWGHNVFVFIMHIFYAIPFKIGVRFLLKDSLKAKEEMDKAM